MLDVFDLAERQAALEQALENARKQKDEKNFNLSDARDSLDLRIAKEREEEGKLKSEMRNAKKEKKLELMEKQKQSRLKQLELNAEKKELMRLVVDELRTHEAKIIE